MTTAERPFPDDLLQLQEQLHRAHAEHRLFLAGPPWSVEPLKGWTRTEGSYSHRGDVPDSPGWTQEEKDTADRMWKEIRELSIAVVDPPPLGIGAPRRGRAGAYGLEEERPTRLRAAGRGGVAAVPGPEPLLPLPPELDQLELIRRWLALTLARVDEKITAVRAEEAEKASRRPLPEPPRWWIEYSIGARRTPERVHTSDCTMTGRGRPTTAESARDILLTVPDARACYLCRPDSALGLLDA
ncbi:DUF6233 domain-containing protein [Streptomyces sp. NPDC051555]|uniref:DUF6233 domain-containing protein n=1 Tax=Streptomyces sp. NPDC051555 TaxID=3365657 RepID=UPI0037B53015